MFDLEMTCGACPEQYDVYLGGKKVGYMRLRHGFFRCDYPDAGGETVYSTSTIGDGIFEDEDERHVEITKALIALSMRLGIYYRGYDI